MTIGLRNLEWANHNSQRNYPLVIEATRTDVTSSFALPNDFITGLYLSVHFGLNVDPAKFYLRSLGNFASGFGMVIAYDSGAGPVNVATANIARAAFSPGQSYRLTGIGDFFDATGHVQLGSLSNIDEQPAGQFSFDFAATRLETDVVRPMVRGISSFRVQSGSALSDPISGDLVLVAGTNMRITVVQQADQDPRIVFDAIEGEGLNEICVCDDDPELAPPIRRINGVPPTTDGDFTLLGSDCLEVRPMTNGLQLVDTCSVPCCGCTELEIVTAQLEQFLRQATTLENFLVRLEAVVEGMNQSVLGSRLNDRTCVEPCN